MTTHAEPEPLILEAEVVAVDGVPVEQLMPQPPQYPPAVHGQVSCRCGKRSVEAHGGFSCGQVLAIAARVNHSPLPFWQRLRAPKPVGWRLSRRELIALQDQDRHVESEAAS